MALMWMAPYKTYSQTKVLYPAALWARVEEYASSLVYFVQPPPAALLYPNHHFLTPCNHFLVRALIPHTVSPSHCSLWIYHPPAASRCFWVAPLSRRQRMPAVILATVTFFNFYFSLSLVFALYCNATEANFLWRGDSCQEKWVYKWTAN